jgi:hypothetical protein
MPEGHFPPPWSVEQLDSCFVVKDLNGQALALAPLLKGAFVGVREGRRGTGMLPGQPVRG